MKLIGSLFNILSSIFLFALSLPAFAETPATSIGVITPLTGYMATIGTALKNGIELARFDRPELFRNTKFIYEDDQFDAKQSLTAYQKLRDLHDVPIVFGFGDTLGLVLGPRADRDGVILINFNFEPTPAIGRALVVRSMNHTLQYMEALAEYLNALGNSKFIVLQAESPFFNSMVSSFRAAVNGHGSVEILPAFTPTDSDFKSAILKLKAKPKTPIGLFMSPHQILNFIKQAKELQLDREYFGTDLFETSAGIASDATNLQGCLYPDNQASAEFRASYRARFGNDAQLTFAATAYEMAILVGDTVSAGTPAQGQNLINAFSRVQKRHGSLGQFSFIDDSKFGKYFEYPVSVKRIVGTLGVPISGRQ